MRQPPLGALLVCAALLIAAPAPAEDSAAKLSLSPAEAAFSARTAAAPLRALINPGSLPYARLVEGRLVGIIPDFCALIQQRSGIRMDIIVPDSYRDYVRRIDGCDFDLLLDAVPDSRFGLPADFAFTRSYISVGFTNVSLKSAADSQMVRVASPPAYSAAQVYIQQHYHSEQIVICGGLEDCLAALKSGRCNVAVLSDFTADILIDGQVRSPYKKAFTAISDEPIPISIALRRQGSPGALPGADICLELLNRAIESISPTTGAQIILRHTRSSPPEKTFMDSIYLHPFTSVAIVIALGLLLLLIVVIIYQKKRQRTQESYRHALELAVERAETANQAKAEFLSRVSHDIRTPINIIGSMTDFALEDIDSREKLEGDLAKIKSANTFLLSLINDVLDISKIDSGKIEIKPVPYNFDDYIANIRNMLEPLCAQKGIEVSIVSRGGQRSAIVDSIRLNQITLNLLSNAVKYTPEGGTVTCTLENSSRPDGRIDFSLEVRDTGIGMSAEFQQHMFDPFSQEYDNPRRPKASAGTGLGLSIVKRIVELMNGSISVESARGQGTAIRCSFVLDAAPPTAPASSPSAVSCGVPASPPPASLPRGRAPALSSFPPLAGRVLLAEDNDLNAEIAQRLLEGFGLASERAKNGATAVKRFATSEPGYFSLILMDIQMPVLNGYEATDAIRALSRSDSGSVPIIAMTADAFDADVEKSLSSGMTAHVAKPIDRSALYAALAAALRSSALR